MKFLNSKIRVKFVTRSGTSSSLFAWKDQCPGGEPSWGDCEFFADPGLRDYDWFIVLDDLPRVLANHVEPLNCPASNTILVTSEPSSVTCYGRAFAAQFGRVLTSQDDLSLPHPNAIRSQTGNIWFYGKSFDDVVGTSPQPKEFSISTVCSSKRHAHTMHARRYDFTMLLKQVLPQIEIFGHGVRFVENKALALDRYRFHLIIENNRGRDCWTEKLADAFLGFCVPIYCGCTNVFDYFPEDSVIPFDIDDFDTALSIIHKILETPGEYERRLPAVIEARKRVIYEYNLPAMINKIITEQGPAVCDPRRSIYSRRLMRLLSPEDLARHAIWKSRNALQALRKKITYFF